MNGKLANLTDLKECPHCGSEVFVIHNRLYGTVPFYERFDGEETENIHMWEHAGAKPQKSVYCGRCNAKIAKDNR